MPVASGQSSLEYSGNELYHLGASSFALDLEIRTTMQKNKLTDILAIQSIARNNPPKSRKCIFCKLIPETQSQLLNHMQTEHGFHLGSPHNLVYLDEFLTLLEHKMGHEGKCIYCEGVFPDMVVLRRHMRKKKHFRVNPWNCNYDRFYVLNYADFEGKRWREVEGNQGFDEGVDDDVAADGGDKDEDWEGWTGDGERTMCLFDDMMFGDVGDAVMHLKEVHRFDLREIKLKYELDEYGVIRLINFIRACSSEVSCFGCHECFHSMEDLSQHYQESQHHLTLIPKQGDAFWSDVEHLFPSYEGDPLLTWDCED
ncbi:hypothetical protein BC830DRAFT_890674 [Chytriomyces sp. MP71]|nr:hypothetical protein BC830DRAFT_890674 [Chytriomyces sp. MP71]